MEGASQPHPVTLGAMTDEVRTGDVPTGELRAGELPTGELRAGELVAGELAAGELAARELRAGKFRAGELCAGVPEAGTRRRYLIADVFTSPPLEGTQLAVFPDGDGRDDHLMQRTAPGPHLSWPPSSPPPHRPPTPLSCN